MHAFHGAGWLSAGVEPARTGNRHPSIAPYGTFRCADASVVIAVGSESLWRRFAGVVGIDPDRPDVATNRLRVAQVDDLEAEVERLLQDSLADDVIAELGAAGVPAGRIRTVPEVYDWEQVRGLGLLHTMTHPLLGEVTVPGGAVRYDGMMAASPTPPPLLGEHEDGLDSPWEADR